MKYMQKMTFRHCAFCSIKVFSQISLSMLTTGIGENVKHDSFLFGGSIAWLYYEK